MVSLDLVTAPAEEPMTTAEAKSHLRVDSSSEDALIDAYVAAARSFYEEAIWRALITQTWALRLEQWPWGDSILLPRPPLQSVTSITYVDSDGDTNTMSSGDYTVYAQDPGRVWLGYSKSWPSATLRPGPAITITFVAGYGDAEDVQEIDKQAVRLILGHFYENREEVVAIPGISLAQLPMAAQSIIRMRRSWVDASWKGR
ncbi:MAG TPA: head-tail connector protein [Candidatus Competibacter phosphatis]|nr:head-tail connector protein [Candidatus Competibacter phosphatis]